MEMLPMEMVLMEWVAMKMLPMERVAMEWIVVVPPCNHGAVLIRRVVRVRKQHH